jgi:predicted nucleic acid-binding protein
MVQLIESAQEVFLPFAVLGELRAGFVGGTKAKENEAWLARFLKKPGVFALFADADTAVHYASIKVQMHRRGMPIPINDLWIAALSVQHGLRLCTRDRHFEQIPQLMRI